MALDLSRAPDIEYSALQILVDGEKRLSELGVTVWLVDINPGVLAVIHNTHLAQRLGRERMLFDAHLAIHRYQAMAASAPA